MERELSVLPLCKLPTDTAGSKRERLGLDGRPRLKPNVASLAVTTSEVRRVLPRVNPGRVVFLTVREPQTGRKRGNRKWAEATDESQE